MPLQQEREKQIQKIVQSLLPYQPEKVLLFGSAARGDTHRYSDIDLIIVKKTDRRFLDRPEEVEPYLPTDIPVDILVYTPDELKKMVEEKRDFIMTALEEGRVMYEQKPNGSREVDSPGSI